MEVTINKHQAARISIIAASVILMFFGLLHLHGTFFSSDLYPADSEITKKLQTSAIQMDESGIIWWLWIGFNAMFSVGLIFIASVNLYLATRHFELIKIIRTILLFTIASNTFFVWTGYNYMISDFGISMAIPLLFFTSGYILIQTR
jgi:hypothetical protein